MRIDTDKHTEARLIDLNNRILQRLRFLACGTLSHRPLY